MSLVVLKLGGSLLACPAWPDRLRELLRQYASHRVLIVVGGGEAADVVREWSHTYSLSEESAHWIAVRSLSVTRALVRLLLPECGEVTSRNEAMRWWAESPAPLLLDLETYLRQTELSDDAPLPHTWDVTSDSIAAWVAARWSADELVLLKSINLPSGASLDQARREELVDAYFPQIANELPRVRWCNLSEENATIRNWLTMS